MKKCITLVLLTGALFLASACHETEEAGCGKVTKEGTCEGNVLYYCENEQLMELDCTKEQKTCSWNNDKKYNDCMSKNPGGNNPGGNGGGNCGNVDNVGQCDGNTAFWCDKGQLYKEECDKKSKQCGMDPQYKYYTCL